MMMMMMMMMGGCARIHKDKLYEFVTKGRPEQSCVC